MSSSCLLPDGRRRPILNVNAPNLIYVANIPVNLSFKKLRDSVVGDYGRARFIETFEAWTKRPIGKIIVEFADVDSLDKFEAALRKREVLEYSDFLRLQNKPQFFAHVLRETGVDLLGCGGIPPDFSTHNQQQPRQPPSNVRMSSGGRPPSAVNGGAHNNHNPPARPPSRAFADRTRPQFPNNPDARPFVSKWNGNNNDSQNQQQQQWGDNNNDGEQQQSPFSRARSTERRPSPPPFRSTNGWNGNTSMSTTDSWSNTSTPPNNNGNGFGRRGGGRGGFAGRGGGFAAFGFAGRGGRGRGTPFGAALLSSDKQNSTQQNGFVNGVGGDASANTDNQNSTQENGFVNGVGGDASANTDNQNNTEQNGFVNGGGDSSSDLLLSHDEMVRTNASVSSFTSSSPPNTTSASSPSVDVQQSAQQQQSPVFSQYRVPRVRRSSGGDDEDVDNAGNENGLGPKKTLLVCKLVDGFDMDGLLVFLQGYGEIDTSRCKKLDKESASFTFPEAVDAQSALTGFLRGDLEPVIGTQAEARLI